MSGLNIKLSLEIGKRLDDNKRIINFKLPSYGNDFCGQLFLKKYNIYHYDLKSGKIHFKKPLLKSIINFVKWILKCVVFVLEIIFPVFTISLSQILSLTFEAAEVGRSISENFSKKDYSLLRSLSKHIRISKKPRKKYKRIKKVIYAVIDGDTTPQNITALQLLAELIEAKYIGDCCLVLLSKIKLISPPQETIDLYGDEEKNQFVSNFRASFLEYILNENYVEATEFIKGLLEGQIDLNVNSFEFIIQCLAFCYKNLNEDEFITLFEGSSLNINNHLCFGKKLYFIENTGHDNSFLRFCYMFLEKYYNDRPRVNQDGLTTTFKRVVLKAKEALAAKDEFLAAVKLLAKYSQSEETVDSYIIASVHTEYVKNRINDECILALKEYENLVPRAKLFIKLLTLNEKELPEKEDVLSIFETLRKFENVDPIVQLCFMYYLVNPVYKSNCFNNEFINHYKILFNQAENNNCNTSLLCLFAAQFLLLYATVEDISTHKQNAKFSNRILSFVIQNKVLLENKKVYFKIVRSINGIFIDDYRENLIKLQSIKNDVKQDIFEHIFYQINLGVLYAYNTDFKNAVNAYKNINVKVLKKMPLCIRATFFNNFEVIKYLDNPSFISAQQALNNIKKFISANFTKQSITEELRHLQINYLIFSIIVYTQNNLDNLFETTYTYVRDDNYFKFYYQQAEWLYSILTKKYIKEAPLIESVFFTNKKALFQNKRLTLNNYLNEKKPSDLSKVNDYLNKNITSSDDLNFFKRAELFSLVERWYE